MAIAQVFKDFIKYTRFVVGDGVRIRFWEDLWWGISLCVLNSHVYLGLSQLNTFLFHQFLASLIFYLGTFNFCCSLSNFEIGDLERLMSSLTLLYLSLSIPDART